MDVKLKSFTPREGHKLRMFENKVMRILCSPKKAQMIEEWRKLYNEELSSFCASPSNVN
jgi:hypothetical protein